MQVWDPCFSRLHNFTSRNLTGGVRELSSLPTGVYHLKEAFQMQFNPAAFVYT